MSPKTYHERNKGVVLFGGSRLERIGFSETIKVSFPDFDFQMMSVEDILKNPLTNTKIPFFINHSYVAVIILKSRSEAETVKIRELMHLLAPCSIVLALSEAEQAIHPSEWPKNLRGVVNWEEIWDRVETFLTLISKDLAVFDPNLTSWTETEFPPNFLRSSATDQSDLGSITRREEEVAQKISCGLINREIASDLGIAVNTVNAHVHSLIHKLGVKNRTEVAVWYLNRK